MKAVNGCCNSNLIERANVDVDGNEPFTHTCDIAVLCNKAVLINNH